MSLMSKITMAATAAAFSVVALPSANAAVIYSLTGNTTNVPVYNRVLAGDPPTSLSAVGTAVSYNTLLFTVNTAGPYDFLLTSTTAGYDPFLTLYQGVFDPGSPLAGALVANDDFTSIVNSGFSRALVTGQIYTAVITGFDNADFGGYVFTISDQVASAVPEPATWAMMLAGFGMVGFGMRRRGAVRTTVSFA